MKLLRGTAIGAGAAFGLALVAPASAHAQAQEHGTRFGVEAAYADHYNLGVGAFVKFHLTEMSGHPITGRVSFDYFFPGSGNYCGGFTDCGVTVHFYQLAADALYDLTAHGNVKPYLGAGLGYDHFSLTYKGCPECGTYTGGTGGIGLNILGGLNFMANSKLMPFVEAKLGIGGSTGGYGGSEFVLKGGIHF
ncbi:MAG: outer membrane beta-barrel protein [Gemmatimonadales bacterium]